MLIASPQNCVDTATRRSRSRPRRVEYRSADVTGLDLEFVGIKKWVAFLSLFDPGISLSLFDPGIPNMFILIIVLQQYIYRFHILFDPGISLSL